MQKLMQDEKVARKGGGREEDWWRYGRGWVEVRWGTDAGRKEAKAWLRQGKDRE